MVILDQTGAILGSATLDMIKKIHRGIFVILGYEQSKNLPALWKFSRGQKWAFPN
jgi:hypothetical protein